MGDATTRVEDELVTDRDVLLRSQVLQLPRQGDDTCCTAPFLQTVHPELAVVGRSGDRPLAPHLAARLMDVPLYITGRHGTLELISDGITVRVRSRR
jgi:beta-lactamase superfamily II metal-dependent hydrolase